MFSIPTDVSDEPAAQPPPGVESNFIDPPSLQPAIVLLEAVFTPLILLAVAIRVYVRTRVLKLWGWEDTTCLLALCGSIANLAMVMKCMFLGIGRHMWNVPLKIFLDPLNNRILAVNITYPWAVCFAKLSILLLYKRLFPVGHEKIVIWVGLILISVLYATFITLSIVNIAICTDIYSQVSFFCAFAYRNVVIWTGTVNVATDLYVIVLLINQFRKLQMSLRRKVGLCCIFALGIGACAASIARLVIIVKNMDSTDSTWVSAELSLFTITEINIGIIVSCVCTFPKFVHRMREFHPYVADKVSWVLGRRRSYPRDRVRGRGQLSLERILPLHLQHKQKPAGIHEHLRNTRSGSGSETKLEVHSAEVAYNLENVSTRELLQPRYLPR